MSGYRRVNYYELCRLCTSSEGTKLNIFRDEGRRRQLQNKIQTCLPVQVLEEDSLPKVVCHDCIRKLENFMAFREAVVGAESMLDSYFSSLRYSEDFLKEGKVYVKTTEKEHSPSPSPEIIPVTESCEEDPLKGVEKVVSDQPQHSHPVLVSNINASNIQIISGVQARVQQYKCAMQSGSVAATVVEATTAETHYSYQQQISPQSQTQNQMEMPNQLSQNQMQPLRQMTQPLSTINQNQRDFSAQGHLTQQIQQLQRQYRDYEKRHVQIDKEQAQSLQNNNIVLKEEEEPEPSQQVIQKVQDVVVQKHEPSEGTPTYTTMQAPEVFLSLGFKDNSLSREENREIKQEITRNSMGPISEFLKIRPMAEPSSLITVNPQIISQTVKHPSCRECGKTFATVNLLNSHTCGGVNIINDQTVEIDIKDEQTQPNGSREFSCEICAKPFKRKEHLFQHRKLHTGERPYICPTCSKAFSRKEHLVRHLVSHTGQKMHECEVCGKSFSRKDNLHKHRKTHGVSGPYICDTCGKSFVIKHYYLMHLTTHTPADASSSDPLPYKCDICHRAFSVKQYLMTHKLRHRSKNNSQNGAHPSREISVNEEDVRGNISDGAPSSAAIADIHGVDRQNPGTFSSGQQYQADVSQFQ